MKQKLLYICLVIIALGWSGKAVGQEEWGKYTSYVLDEPNEESLFKSNITGTHYGTEFNLSGPGKMLTFDGKKQRNALDGFYLEESDGGNWQSQQIKVTTDYKNYSIQLNENIKSIRFAIKPGASLTHYYKNVKVTRATTLSTATTSLDFGNVRKGETKELTVSVDYNNTTYPWQIMGTCDNPDFQVETVTAGEYGTVLVTVKYIPTSTGIANGTVTLHMNGVETSFSVLGVGETIYYGKADVQNTEGGEAYVSIQGYETTTDKSYSFDSGVTTEASASINVYYSAQPNEGYAFVGWQNIETEKILSKDEQYTHNFTYTSEDANEPTLLSLKALFQKETLVLEPTSPAYEEGFYKHVVLNRILKQGYNTIALPFETNIRDLTKRDDEDWVAQLHTVAYSEADGFSLYFQKVEDGTIRANEPYVVYLSEAVENPKWENVNQEIAAPEVMTINAKTGYGDYGSWKMTSNFTAGFPMNGNYGIVNDAGGLKQGTEGSTLNAFAAYIAPALEAENSTLRIRAAYVDSDGTTTFVDSLPDESEVYGIEDKTAAIYGLDGTRRAALKPGVNIVRYANGQTRKVYR